MVLEYSINQHPRVKDEIEREHRLIDRAAKDIELHGHLLDRDWYSLTPVERGHVVRMREWGRRIREMQHICRDIIRNMVDGYIEPRRWHEGDYLDARIAEEKINPRIPKKPARPAP